LIFSNENLVLACIGETFMKKMILYES